MSLKTEGFESGYELMVSVATNATLSAKQVMGWDNLTGLYKATPTAVTVTTTMATSAATALTGSSDRIWFSRDTIRIKGHVYHQDYDRLLDEDHHNIEPHKGRKYLCRVQHVYLRPVRDAL